MNEKVRRRRDQLWADYTKVVGHPFDFFYCPVLFRDENVPLCQGHIVNKVFGASSREWTVQRQDVDSFYGSNFEADFEMLQYDRNRTTDEIFMDKELRKKFDPKILLDGKQVAHFVAHGKIPEEFTKVEFEKDGQSIVVGLKIAPDLFDASADRKWEIDTSRDIRIAALVSLIKAAHLTLFEMLGYQYALSAAGEFVGRQILGQFLDQNRGKPKATVLENAFPHFREFAHMVRPVLSYDFDFQGTITDRMLLLCWGSSGFVWAKIVFVRTGKFLHAVILPVYDRAEMVPTYIDFLRNQSESISVTVCRYEPGEERWEAHKDPTHLTWPKRGILYP